MIRKIWKNKRIEVAEDEFSNALKALLGDARDIGFACRLAFEEGPWAHAYANRVIADALLEGLGEVCGLLGEPITPYDGEVVEVPMHRPPGGPRPTPNGKYPVDLPVSLIIELAGGDETKAQEMIDAISDGAPHHVMMNILLLHVAEVLIARARAARKNRGVSAEEAK